MSDLDRSCSSFWGVRDIQAGNIDEHEAADALPASSSASESQGDSADADLETGIAEWRTRGLPPAQSKAQRWGAPYHLQFAILFTRSVFSLPFHAMAPCHCCLGTYPQYVIAGPLPCLNSRGLKRNASNVQGGASEALPEHEQAGHPAVRHCGPAHWLLLVAAGRP